MWLQGRLAGVADQPRGHVTIGEAGDLDDLQGGGVEATDAGDHRLRCGVGEGPGRGEAGRHQLLCEQRVALGQVGNPCGQVVGARLLR